MHIPTPDYRGDMVRDDISRVCVEKVAAQPCVLLATLSSPKGMTIGFKNGTRQVCILETTLVVGGRMVGIRTVGDVR